MTEIDGEITNGGFASVRNESLARNLWVGRGSVRFAKLRHLLRLGLWATCSLAASGQIQAFQSGKDTNTGLASLDDLISYALANNPEIRAASLSHEAALERIPQATAWPNPELHLRYFAEEVQTRVGPQEYAFGFNQPLPWPKRLKLQGEMASHAATSAAAEVDVARHRLVAEVTRLWYELSLLTRSVAIMQSHRDLVISFEGVARARFATGSARHPDVIRASIELGNVENQLASLKDRRFPLVAALNGLLHRPPSAWLPDPPSLVFHPLRRDEQEVLKILMRTNPGLRSLDFQAASAEARFKHAQTASLPKLVVGLDYMVVGPAMASGVRGSSQDPISANLRITLPLTREKYRAEQREARASLEAIRARHSTEVDRLRASAISQLYELRDAEREVVLFRTVLLPKTKEALGALQRAYSSGTASFNELIETLRVQLDLELGQARAIANHGQAHAGLNELLGGALRELEAPDSRQ